MGKVPSFPVTIEPGEWPEFTLWAATLFLESAGEPDQGVLGVSHVIKNRVDKWRITVHQAILGPDARAYGDNRAFEPFSCWNDDYKGQALARLTRIGGNAESSWKYAAAGMWRMLPDPTNGATHYLNEELTRRIRGGTLPTWAADPNNSGLVDQRKVAVKIGQHTFLYA